jgi:hypothetical protein
MPPDDIQPVREKLEKAEHRLEAAMGEVCDDTSRGGVRKPDTGELIRMDETLTLAAQAAKQAIILRRQLRRKSPPDGTDRPKTSPEGTEQPSERAD